MGDVDYFKRMFRYDDWANAGHLEAMRNGEPVPAALRAMAHVLSARAIWIKRVKGEPTDGMVFYPELDLDACTDLHEQVSNDWQEWLETPTPSGLTDRLSPSSWTP